MFDESQISFDQILIDGQVLLFPLTQVLIGLMGNLDGGLKAIVEISPRLVVIGGTTIRYNIVDVLVKDLHLTIEFAFLQYP